MSAHFERMVSVSDPAVAYAIDIEKVQALNADIVVDYAYCTRNASACAADAPLSGLLSYGNGAELLELPDSEGDKLKVIQIQVAGRSYIEVVESFQKLALAVGEKPNHDDLVHCEQFRTAMQAMQASAKRLWARKIRVLTASIYPTTMYLAQPTDDPILIMLEQLGVPMVHVTVNDPRGSYWEYVTWDHASGEVPEDFPKADIILYDGRAHESHFLQSAEDRGWNLTHPAFAETPRQIASWPIDTSFSYERATRILYSIAMVFDQSVRRVPETSCTLSEPPFDDELPRGAWRCHDPEHAMAVAASLVCPANTGASDFAVAVKTESALRAQLDDAENDIPTWGIAVIAVVASVLVATLALMGIIIRREKIGNPIFKINDLAMKV